MTKRVKLKRVAYMDFLKAAGWENKTNMEIISLLDVTSQQLNLYKNQEGFISLEVVTWSILKGLVTAESVRDLMLN